MNIEKMPQDQIDKILDRRTPYLERLEKPDVSPDLREMMSEFLTKSQDKVTGLQARWALDEALDELRKREIPHAVAAIDFRNLGGLNTAFEHEKTNEILREVAKDYIQKNTREWGGEVYRSGGDEFHAVVPYMTHKELNKKMEGLQVQIQKGVVEVRGLTDLPHKSQNGMPTGAGNIDFGCADSSIKDRSEMLKVSDRQLTAHKSEYLEDVRARELKHDRLWEYNSTIKKYELSVDLNKEIDHEHGNSIGKIEGTGTGGYDSKGVSGVREKDGGRGIYQERGKAGREGEGIREEQSRVPEEKRSPAEEKNARVIVDELVKYAGGKKLTVPEKTQERWQTLIDGGESDVNIRSYIDSYSKIRGFTIAKPDEPQEKPKNKNKDIGMDI